MMNLRPKEKKQVEGIQNKISKLGFSTKLRFVYLAKKDILNKGKVVNGFVGFIKQFTDMDINQLKPDMDITATSTSYFFKSKRLNERKRKIMKRYKTRDLTAGRTPGIFNIEELATIWHFPLESAVKAPMIQKTPGKKAEAPMTLPIGEEIVSEDVFEPIFEDETHSKERKFNKREVNEDDFWKVEEDEEDESLPKVEAKAEKRGSPPANLPFA
jgi:hypothetical protein